MPTRAPSVCPTCRGLGCRGHHPRRWGLNNTGGRIGGSKAQALRAKLLKRNPWCAQCLKSNRWVLAAIRDHIIPLAEGGTEEPSNTQALCVTCHNAKSQAEAQRARFLSR